MLILFISNFVTHQQTKTAYILTRFLTKLPNEERNIRSYQ